MRRERYRTKLRTFILTALVIGGVFFVLPRLASAAAVNLGLTPAVGSAIGLGSADIRVTAAKIIRNLFGLLGIVAVAIILYGGFLWMTSQGEEETINKAKRVIVNGVIGLAIILSAVAITQFILSRLTEATGLGGGGGGGGGGFVIKSGALGQGIIESHYPERGQTDVARNTRIVVTFKETMDLSSLIQGYNENDPASSTKHDLNDANVKIFTKAAGVAGAFKSNEVQVFYTPDHKTFVFHVPLLGSPTQNVPYLVDLAGGANGLKKIGPDGKSAPAFDGSFAQGYEWDFTTGTFIDTEPPRVESVYPYPANIEPRNTLVQINFNEAIDPTTVVGNQPGFNNLVVGLAAPPPIAGSFAIGNRYRTVEFTPNDLCGQNSCGGNVYCLPGASDIAARARAATLGPTPPQADPTKVPADGVTDMVGNSLDGNGDGAAEGPVKDDYAWNFKTDNTIDLIPPVVESTDPDIQTGKVPAEKIVDVKWTKVMSLLSFNSTAVTLSEVPNPPNPPLPEPTCYALSGANMGKNGEIATSTPPVYSELFMNHCLFQPETNYIPNLSSKLLDIRQNCYYPGAKNYLAACNPDAMAAGNYSYCCNGMPCSKACKIQGVSVICPN